MNRHSLAVKRAALTQTEIDLNDPITVGYKQMLVNELCKKYESSPNRAQNGMDRHARDLISPKIPHGLKKMRTRNPQAFAICPGIPFSFTDSDGVEQMVILNPDIVLYFSQEEMSNIVIKAKDSEIERERNLYASIVKSAEMFLKMKDKLRERQIHYATFLNLPKFNTYKSMLKATPEYFEKLFKLRTGFDLLDKYGEK